MRILVPIDRNRTAARLNCYQRANVLIELTVD